MTYSPIPTQDVSRSPQAATRSFRHRLAALLPPVALLATGLSLPWATDLGRRQSLDFWRLWSVSERAQHAAMQLAQLAVLAAVVAAVVLVAVSLGRTRGEPSRLLAAAGLLLFSSVVITLVVLDNANGFDYVPAHSTVTAGVALQVATAGPMCLLLAGAWLLIDARLARRPIG